MDGGSLLPGWGFCGPQYDTERNPDEGENAPKFEDQCWMKSSDGEMVSGGAIKESKERKGWERGEKKGKDRGDWGGRLQPPLRVLE
jgi:hypothetical protein